MDLEAIREWVVDIAQVFIAMGTLMVAVVAIWGDWFRDKFAPPKLNVELRETKGNLTWYTDGTPTYYWHLRVKNSRTWSPARGVQVKIIEVKRQAEDNQFHQVDLPASVQLRQPFPSSPINSDSVIYTEKLWDFGELKNGFDRFVFTISPRPNNWKGDVMSGDAVQVKVIAVAGNHRSKPYYVQITWDGLWADDPDELDQHLVVQEVSNR